jgi:hypothetical protein
MPDPSMFRFIAVRPAVSGAPDRDGLQIRPFPGARERAKLFPELEQAAANGATRDEIIAIVDRFRASANYVRDVEDLALPLRPVLNWIADNRLRPLKELNLRSELEAVTKTRLSELVKSDSFLTAIAALADTLLAASLAGPASGTRSDDVTAGLKALQLIRLAADGRTAPASAETPARHGRPPSPSPDTPPKPPVPMSDSLGSLVSRLTVVLPGLAAFVTTEDEDGEEQEDDEQEPDPRERQEEELRERLAALADAHRVLSRMASEEHLLQAPSEDAQLGAIELAGADVPGGVDAPHAGIRPAGFTLAPEAAEGLSGESRRVLADLGVDLARIRAVDTVGLIEDEIGYVGSRLASQQRQDRVLVIAGARLYERTLRTSLGLERMRRAVRLLTRGKCTFQAGIGDLLMVKLKLKAYHLADFAHVENALAGEHRERQHRRLNQREEILVVEEERETETERDLQSTERNELQTEAEQTIKSELEVEAGLQVSGSYGPSVTFTASMNAGFSTTTEEAQRKAQSYSREVTERTAERVRERVREERRRRVLEELEEINKHAIDNTGPNRRHTRGIYRWLLKISDAQIFNYGQRMMYEFVIPEPAAFFLYAFVENPPADIELPKPDPPTYFGSPLKPSNLTRTNYQDYVSKYEATDAPAPPSQFTVASHFDKQDGKEDNNFGRALKIPVAAGYEAYGATVSSDFVFPSGQAHGFRIMVGGVNFDRTNLWGAGYQTFPYTFRGEVAVALELMNVRSFALGVDVFCRLTADGLAKWQHEVYEAVIQGYLKQQAEYEDKVAAAAIEQGVQILGRNPLENRRLEREELKKLVLMMLIGSTDIGRNSLQPSVEPTLDISKACLNGAYIRFLENAFEWANMLYVFYPYFWGRKARWISAVHLTDPDPDFAAFLKAGAARVQVPVRPGFEHAVAYFSQSGQIWDGNDAPLIDDDLYVPIVDEISANLGRTDDGVPYPKGSQPWEVTVPTSLVVLQDLDEIPGIRDILTDKPIDLVNARP